MSEVLRPASEADVADMIAASRGEKKTLALRGGGTRAGLGRPVSADTVLDLSGLRGVTLYEPSEMVLAARAGTSLAEIEAMLAQRGQMLPFEPADHRRLYGSAGEPSIGAIAACNISGPRRIQVGAARDHLIGLRLVNGRGEVVKTGGRVMKNVTGLDLVKLNAGAFGMLGALTEVTFKLLPRPERVATLAFEGLADDAAIRLLSRALGSPFEVTGAAHLPSGIAGGAARTLVRLEGFSESIAYRLEEMRKLTADFAAGATLDEGESEALWRDIRDAAFFEAPTDAVIWRVSLPPDQAAAMVGTLRGLAGLRHFYDWGGGLVWLATAGANAPAIRAATAAHRGHATLIRAFDAVRAATDVFEPLTPALLTLTAGIKKSFDPDGILNPGRMYEGV